MTRWKSSVQWDPKSHGFKLNLVQVWIIFLVSFISAHSVLLFGWLKKITVPNITWCSLKWPGIVENSTSKTRKKSHTFIVFIKKQEKHVFVWHGLKWRKFLFHITHWADIISNDTCKCSIILKNSLPAVLIKRENPINGCNSYFEMSITATSPSYRRSCTLLTTTDTTLVSDHCVC